MPWATIKAQQVCFIGLKSKNSTTTRLASPSPELETKAAEKGCQFPGDMAAPQARPNLDKKMIPKAEGGGASPKRQAGGHSRMARKIVEYVDEEVSKSLVQNKKNGAEVSRLIDQPRRDLQGRHPAIQGSARKMAKKIAKEGIALSALMEWEKKKLHADDLHGTKEMVMEKLKNKLKELDELLKSSTLIGAGSQDGPLAAEAEPEVEAAPGSGTEQDAGAGEAEAAATTRPRRIQKPNVRLSDTEYYLYYSTSATTASAARFDQYSLLPPQQVPLHVDRPFLLLATQVNKYSFSPMTTRTERPN
uniref:Uncharacterized protein n=1 Tax=Leersia perrieri TaxID=77586 RepID=A0A0D9WBS8_9ORYZ